MNEVGTLEAYDDEGQMKRNPVTNPTILHIQMHLNTIVVIDKSLIADQHSETKSLVLFPQTIQIKVLKPQSAYIHCVE